METRSNLHVLPAKRDITVAEIDAGLEPVEEQLVELAARDVADDLDLMGYSSEQVPERHHRRLILTRAQWRRSLTRFVGGAMALADEYRRLLEEIDIYLELHGPAKRRGRKH